MRPKWGDIHVVVGGQFGSEGKGAFTAALTRRLRSQGRGVILVRVAGPNAGHTAYDDSGEEWKLRQIPVGAVADLEAPIVIAAGSEIDLAVLREEIDALEYAGIPIVNRLLVDGSATVIEDEHKRMENGLPADPGLWTKEEDLQQRIGSTAKGIGAARAERAMRRARLYRQVDSSKYRTYIVRHTADYLRKCLRNGGDDVIIEGTQGYGLGLHTEWYPYTTSSDCRFTDFLAMAGISHFDCQKVVPWVVFRNETIRVAGNSGPLHGETTWEALGLPNEQTTVTKKTRRVGCWDIGLASAAIAANGQRAVRVAYMMADHQYPELAGVEDTGVLNKRERDIVNRLHDRVRQCGADGLSFLGTGPATGFFLGTANLQQDELRFGEQGVFQSDAELADWWPADAREEDLQG